LNPLADAIDLSRLDRVLVIKLRHHGDVLLASPVFSVLKRHAPQLEIDALAYADTAAMLSGHPAIAQLHLVDRQWKHAGVAAQAGGEWRLWQALRARRYDLIVHLTEHRRGLWLTRLLKPRFAVAPRPRKTTAAWAGTFSHLYQLPESGNRRHTVETHLDALRRIGVAPAEDERGLTLVPGAAAEARIDALLAEHGLHPRSFLHLHPASRWMFKTWPAARSAELISRLAADGHRIVLTSAPAASEMALNAAIAAQAGVAVTDLSGTLSLKELAALTGRARLFVGVDSAPMHIAAAMGTPAVALFGPSGDIEWGPWRVAQRIVVSNRHPCRPCGMDGCGGSKVSECLTTLPVARVLDEVRSLLGETATA
jgi:heptosyltransferase-3